MCTHDYGPTRVKGFVENPLALKFGCQSTVIPASCANASVVHMADAA